MNARTPSAFAAYTKSLVIFLLILPLSGCGYFEREEGRGRVKKTLTESLPTISELPDSWQKFLGNSPVEFIGRNHPVAKKWDPDYPVRRPGSFGIVKYKSTAFHERYAESPSVQLRLWRQLSPAAAQNFWGDWIIPKATVGTAGFHADTVNSEQEIKNMVPRLSVVVPSSLEWQLVCIAPGPGFKIETAEECTQWTGWTHFCNWNLEVNIYDNTNPPRLIHDKQVVSLSKDLARTVMHKVGCDTQK